MNKYKVHVILEEYYDDIYAEDEETAFVEASNFAMQGRGLGIRYRIIRRRLRNWMVRNG